jgi:hypothetical protein
MIDVLKQVSDLKDQDVRKAIWPMVDTIYFYTVGREYPKNLRDYFVTDKDMFSILENEAITFCHEHGWIDVKTELLLIRIRLTFRGLLSHFLHKKHSKFR